MDTALGDEGRQPKLIVPGEEAYRLARELAELTGEDITAAVMQAIRERLALERDKLARFEKLMRLAAEIRAHMGEPLPSSDHSWLYDEHGLPK